MGLADDLKRTPSGAMPSAFEILAQAAKTDPLWQRAIPSSDSARRWYAAGYGIAEDREVNEPVSSVVPVALRFWWALGLFDAKSGTRPRTAWAPEPDSGSYLPAVLGGLAGALGLGLLTWAGLRRGNP